MRLTWDEKADALQQPYLQKIEKKKLLLLGDNRKLYDCLCSECSKKYIAVEENAESILVNLTREKRWASLVSLYDTYKSVFHTMLGERYGEMYRLYLLNISRYPYQLGVYRRSQRSSEAVRHCAQALQGLQELLYVRAFDMKDEELIARAKEDKMIRDGLKIAWFTVQLLQNNPEKDNQSRRGISYRRDATPGSLAQQRPHGAISRLVEPWLLRISGDSFPTTRAAARR